MTSRALISKIHCMLSVNQKRDSNTIQYLFNHATFRSEKRSLKHVRAKTMYTINTIQYIQFIKKKKKYIQLIICVKKKKKKKKNHYFIYNNHLINV